jgi:cytochrome c553
MTSFRAILLWLMMLAVPFQGYAAAAMALCTPEPTQLSTGVAHDHSQHNHASVQGAEHQHVNVSGDDSADRHDALSAHADQSDAFHKCGSCAACHSVGMMPTLGTPLLHGLPQAELAEPLHAMATVSPRVPHKPPRA